MNFERLGNICSVRNGYAFKSELFNDDGVPVIRISDINGNYVTSDNSIRTPYDKTFEQFILSKGDILIAMSGATTGKYGIYSSDEIGYQNQRVGCFVIKDKTILDNSYLLQTLKFLKPKIEKKAHGSGQPNISAKAIEDFEIPLPPLPDQLHIANLLSKAENLIAQRKESIRLLDEFLKSMFLEMFGDPVRNEKGWEINSLSKFGSLKNGLNYTRSESGINVRCLGVGDFKELSKLADMDSLQVLNLTSEPNNEYFLKDGDLVFVRSNGNRELVGRCLLVFPKSAKVTYSGFCIRYRLEKNGLNPIFISHLFRVPIFRTSMLQGGKGANIQNISQRTLEKLKIPTPPLALQTQFAHIVEKTEALKAQYQQSLQELENLYGSLSQRAFRGELGVKDEAFLMAAEPNAGYKRS